MPKYRDALPQLTGKLFMTDGGLETILVFHEGLDLPHFAAVDLLTSEEGRKTLEDYFPRYIEIAKKHGIGILLETVTWRASRDWGELLGYTPETIPMLNQEAVRQLQVLRDCHETSETPIVVSGCLGPRGDGYDPGRCPTVDEARNYHAEQVEALTCSGADLVSALTLIHTEEAIGIVEAARATGMPVAISFTLETDGRLPTGQALGEAIQEVDRATDGYAAYFGINCAHPTHFEGELEAAGTAPWLARIRQIRGNASTKSHAELDEAAELDDGNPGEFGGQIRSLRERFPGLNILGGCCGTDHRHLEAIAEAVGRNE